MGFDARCSHHKHPLITASSVLKLTSIAIPANVHLTNPKDGVLGPKYH